MAEGLDPEEWAEIMNGAFEHMIKPIYKYEGTLARLMGDALLAFFGAPIAHEDDPQRAILAGLEIVDSLQDYRERIQREYGLDFNVRVGINTGLVVVGAVGSDLRVEYTAMGDAVNLAARMEQTAEPGTVQVAGNTYRIVAPLFEAESRGEIEVKGKAEPVAAYRILKPKAQPGRLRGIEGLESPLIGRATEMQQLEAAFRALREGQGRIVSVMGEAGLGKSRLVAEAMKVATSGTRAERIRWLEGRALSYQTATPYAAFIDLFSRAAGLGPGQSAAEKYERVASLAGEARSDADAEITPYLASVMGIALTGEALQRVQYLEPPQVRGKVASAVTALVAGLAVAGPLTLVFDDVHWIDPTSLELLDSLLPLTAQVPLMIVLLFRPNPQEAPWRLHERAAREHAADYTPITLKPLDQAEARSLVSSLLQIEDLPEKVRSLILAKAEGNPFFVEEVIRSLLDAKLVVRVNSHWRATREIESLNVPDTIAGVITARIDRLDDRLRRAAQTASVVGREFSYSTLGAVHDDPQELDEALAGLNQRELIRDKSLLAHRQYIFKHVLTQETIYNSILLRQRRELHKRVAEALEHAARDRAGDIARHFLEARENARALPYLIEAADKAAHTYSTPEAIGLYKRALQLLAVVDDIGLARRAYEGLGNALDLANEIQRSVDTFQAMLRLARERGDLSMQASALNKLAFTTALRLGQFPQADEYLREAQRLAETVKDRASLAEHNLIRCQMCTFTADFEGVLRYMGNTVEMGREANSKEQQAIGLEHVAGSLLFMTRYEEGWAAAGEALQLSREVGDRMHESMVLAMDLPVYHIRNGDFEGARHAAEEGFKIARQIGALYPGVLGASNLGEIALARGDYQAALQHLQDSLEISLPLEQAMPFLAVQSLGTLGSIYLDINANLAGRAAQYHEHALQLLENPAGRFLGATAWRHIGYSALAKGAYAQALGMFQLGLTHPSILMLVERPFLLAGAARAALGDGRLSEAADYLQQARSYAEERQMKHALPYVEWASAEAAEAQGNTAEALEAYERAEKLAGHLQMRPFVWWTQATEARLLAAFGRDAEAQVKRRQARAIIDELAGMFKEVDLKTMFLQGALARLG
jgi:class 3 adenylate cyclase/tetratricopeptide (TPR) repeat protein